MCGIVGAVSKYDVNAILLEGLKRLEYRGYDSAGVALIKGKTLQRVRTEGKVALLAAHMKENTLSGNIGIAHTRWATHGKPCELNAHPHISSNSIAVVHNGIIENHEALREQLKELGYVFDSETDTEVAVHLIHHHCKSSKSLLSAVHESAGLIQGSFALAVICQNNPDELVVFRRGSPLVIGIGDDSHFVASDSIALQSFAEKVIYLNDGDSALLRADSIEIYDAQNEKVIRESYPLSPDLQSVTKGHYRHFMLKEIFEQSTVITNTLDGRVSSLAALRASFGQKLADLLPNIKNIHIVACGTSYHAGLIAKYWLEELTAIPTHVEIASEYRYRRVVVPEQTLFIAVSQSGETADTLAALEKAKKSHYLATVAICNVASSSLVRETDSVFLTRAGVEIGVASTKAFTTQLVAFLLLAGALSADDKAKQILTELQQLPALCDRVLTMNNEIAALASMFVNRAHALFLGRGSQYPVALEGALKLKEISYIHAEAYPAGELKHGPLALVDKDMPIVVVAPKNGLLDKLISNLHEVRARGGEVLVFADESANINGSGVRVMQIPGCGEWIAPIVYTLPLQMLAYHVAVAKGTDVDQPRNLAKSVTVE